MLVKYSLLSFFLLAFLSACGGGSDDAVEPQVNPPVEDDSTPDDGGGAGGDGGGDGGNGGGDGGNGGGDGGGDTGGTPTDGGSLAANGCLNVVIVNGFAYAACGNAIEVAELATFERSLIDVSANDITFDADEQLLFTQAGGLLTAFDISDPAQPSLLGTASTNFAAFSGLSAANGVLVVSAGAGGSNTQVYTYTNSDNPLTLATNGIPLIDSTTGNPDVTVTATTDGVTAFYSQDIGGVANWAIQIAQLDGDGNVLSVEQDVVLTPGGFSFNPVFTPANFPVESEFLNDRLYVANFAAEGIEVIDLVDDNTLLSPIFLAYEPTNVATDGIQLFVVGASNNTVDVIDLASSTVIDGLVPTEGLAQPVGVAASSTHLVVADRTNGLLIITR